MSQQGKRKTKSLPDFYTQQKIESFLAYFMCIHGRRNASRAKGAEKRWVRCKKTKKSLSVSRKIKKSLSIIKTVT